jgi:hypothetical protein
MLSTEANLDSILTAIAVHANRENESNEAITAQSLAIAIRDWFSLISDSKNQIRSILDSFHYVYTDKEILEMARAMNKVMLPETHTQIARLIPNFIN